MVPTAEQRKAELVEQAIAEARGRLEPERAGPAERFIRCYFRRVLSADVVEADPAQLFGSTYAFFKFAERRQPGEARVRVFNPRIEEHGWRSDRTAVEVVTDDAPFIVASVTAALAQRGLSVHVLFHPVMAVDRDAGGHLRDVADPRTTEAWPAESLIHAEVTRQSTEAGLRDLQAVITGVLEKIRLAVGDWAAMRQRLDQVILDLESPPPGAPAEHAAEVREFLHWVHDNNFTLLGYRDHDFEGEDDDLRLRENRGTALGLLRDPKVRVFKRLFDGEPLPIEAVAFVHRPEIMAVTKANLRSAIHRPVHMDTLTIKKYDAEGRVAGQHVFAGLFTASAYNRTPMQIPLLSRKVARALAASGLAPDSHDGKALMNVFETFPRDELFQISDNDLLDIGLGILHLRERLRVALFVRRDDFERFISCLVYIPRDRYTTDLRTRVQEILEDAFEGRTSAYFIQVGDTPLARLHTIIRTEPGRRLDYDLPAIERRIVEATRSWNDHLERALIEAHGEEAGLALHHRWGEAFPAGYTDATRPEAAVGDVARLEESLVSDELVMTLYRPIEMTDDRVRLKIYHPRTAVPLSDALPMLEHMGFQVIDEIPHAVHPRPSDVDVVPSVMIHDFGLRTRNGMAVDIGAVRDTFREAFRRVWRGDMESDGFNTLVLAAGLDWRQVVVLRAYCRYLRQTGIPFSQAYMEQTLAGNAHLARLIVQLFEARFDPAREADRAEVCAAIREGIDESLEAVASADEDRILRRFVNLVESSLRTNHFQTADGGRPKPWLAVKFDSKALDDLPLPRPWREIFVYSPRFEAVHLRGGPVARGGLRWSDRPEDFRTEILGLVKAQQVKNAVIVPVGSKGGFVLKRAPVGDRAALRAEGVACYKDFVRGLLDLTDNLAGDAVVPPPLVHRHDGDDPYLVVAADKGTATFSDIANSVAAEYGFWLGDAFASGGTHGYDHKKMGITARGAWESVKRHFREMGLDTQSEPFSVIGVGDMSGDVFGNGLLQSPHIRLVAAFNHLHVFIDPDPDPEASFAERARLFAEGRGWDGYDRSRLSPGGAIFERAAKRVHLSAEACRLLGLERATLGPSELIRAILGAPADLLWFGGIGTYVKAHHESHAEAGDRANDALRVDARDLRCKVIGEGANLGVTQRGRIEFALAGGRLNTDSIDNSGGVDCSDHEVNIKILLDKLVAEGDLTGKQRNGLLARMTDEVGELVLRDNYLQTQAITLAQSQGVEVLDQQARLMRMLEKAGRLDRAVEFLPDDETLAEREAAGLGLTRPEISILMPYSKIWLFDRLMESDLPDDPWLAGDLVRYFPHPLRRKYAKAIGSHRLRRELVATYVTNSLVNRVGGSFVTQIIEKTGISPVEATRAYLVAREAFRLRDLWDAIEALDAKVPAAVQTTMLHQINRLLDRAVSWFLRHVPAPMRIGANVESFADGIGELAAMLEDVVAKDTVQDLRQATQRYVDQGVPEDLARRLAGIMIVVSGCDVVRLARRHALSIGQVARLYFAVGARFGLGFMRAAAEALKAENHWQKLAAAALIEDIYIHQVTLTSQVLESTGRDGGDPEGAIDAWIAVRREDVERTEALLGEMWSSGTPDLSMLSVASRQLRTLAEGGRLE